jgi:cell wall-associated NlpC family hydrolase
MKLPVKYGIIGLLTVCITFAGGCSPQTVQQQSSGQPRVNAVDGGAAGGVTMLNATQPASVPIMKQAGVDYVAGNDLAKVLQFNTKWEADRGVYQIGDFDAAYELKVDSTDAVVDEDTIHLAQAPILHNSLVYLPVSMLSDLFKDYMTFEVSENEVKINPSAEKVAGPVDGPEEPNTGGEFDFMDDPDDPFKGEAPAAEEADKAPISFLSSEHSRLAAAVMSTDPEDSIQAVPAAAMKNVDVNKLLAKAKSYMGVKYLFGAPPYPQSSKFDCSTFTRYIYGRFGIQLGRTARAQSVKGTAVSRKQLRKGDLLFFYVPGRFRTNKTVGHVAIYLGNSQIVHSSPKPKDGVQITNINKAYWKETFLKAKRLVY